MGGYVVQNRSYLPLFGERIGYIGWLGHGNMGDEAMYQAVQNCIKEAIVIPYKRIRGAEKIERFCKRRIFDVVMLGGGTLINESTYFNLLQEAQLFGYPTVVFGAGVRNPEFWDRVSPDLNRLREWIPLLEKCKFVGVRGPISKSILEKYGFHKAVVTGDPALLWAGAEVKPKTMTKKIGINLGISPEPTWGTARQIQIFVIDLVRTLIDRGWQITFVPISDEDLQYIRETVHQIERPVRVFIEHHSVKEILRCIESCDIFIGEKLHSVVLACCTYTPSIMLEYRPKCRDFMASLELENYSIRTDGLNITQMLALCDDLYSHITVIRKLMYQRVNSYKKQLIENISFVRQKMTD